MGNRQGGCLTQELMLRDLAEEHFGRRATKEEFSECLKLTTIEQHSKRQPSNKPQEAELPYERNTHNAGDKSTFALGATQGQAPPDVNDQFHDPDPETDEEKLPEIGFEEDVPRCVMGGVWEYEQEQERQVKAVLSPKDYAIWTVQKEESTYRYRHTHNGTPLPVELSLPKVKLPPELAHYEGKKIFYRTKQGQFVVSTVPPEEPVVTPIQPTQANNKSGSEAPNRVENGGVPAILFDLLDECRDCIGREPTEAELLDFMELKRSSNRAGQTPANVIRDMVATMQVPTAKFDTKGIDDRMDILQSRIADLERSETERKTTWGAVVPYLSCIAIGLLLAKGDVQFGALYGFGLILLFETIKAIRRR